MFIGISYFTPSRINLPGQGKPPIPPTPPTAFIELQNNTFIVELENSVDLVGLEN